MKGITKSILIILTFFGFIIMGVLLISKVGDISKLGASVSYDANGCPKDGNKWTLDMVSNICYTSVKAKKSCASGYKWSSSIQKCYKAATRANNNYQCFNGDQKLTNNPLLGSGTYCTRNQELTCSKGKLSGEYCVIEQKAQVKQYKITYNANGGSATKNGKKYSSWSEKATYNTNYVTRNNWYTRNGYVFVGWNEKKDGSGSNWTTWINKKWVWTYKKNVTLYAQWKKGTTLIPDTNFNKCVIDSYNKEKGTSYTYSHVMTIYELNNITNVDCTNRSNINSVTGLEKMIKLKKLDLMLQGTNKISKIDTSKNKQLTSFGISGIPNAEFDLSKNIKLTQISIYDNKVIYSLNLTKNTALTTLNLGSLATLKNINISNNKKILIFNIQNLPNLTTVNYTNGYTIKNKTIFNCPKLK